MALNIINRILKIYILSLKQTKIRFYNFSKAKNSINKQKKKKEVSSLKAFLM